MSTDRTWHKGPPPHAGWWCCTNDVDQLGRGRTLEFWRWWNGYSWSQGAEDFMDEINAARLATAPYTATNLELLWCDYWPEGARVQRVDPNTQAPATFEQAAIRLKAYQLIEVAANAGFNVTISRRPLQPLAMDNMEPVVEVWPKRGVA